MRHCSALRSFAVVAGLVSLACGTRPAYSNPLVYQNTFEDTVGNAWSSTERDTTPVGGRVFLGRFFGISQNTVTFSLAGIPTHSQLTVAFKLYVLLTWDGNFSSNPSIGPDIFTVTADGSPVLNTSFSNGPIGTNQPPQAFPDPFPGGSHPFMTGASETYSLGYYRELEEGVIDAVYDLSLTFAHSASTLTLHLSSTATQGLGDEAWGIDNFVVGLGSTAGVDAPGPGRETPLAVRVAPNPMRSDVRVSFSADRAAMGRVCILGLDGRMIRVLHSGPVAAGSREIAWDGRDSAGQDVASGIYIVSVSAGGRREFQRLVRLK